MALRAIVLDFDGTCTDVEREAHGFLEAYKADLARVLGLEEIEPLWRAKEAAVLAEPSRHGMVLGGRLVAPPVDLYLLATAVGTLIEPDLGDAETERLFKDNYRHTVTAFKPVAREVLEALAAGDVPLHVVTNSEPGKVGAKLDELGLAARGRIHLHGDARKFLVGDPPRSNGDPRFARVPPTWRVEGWDRPIHPRRGHYFDALAAIWDASGTRPEETLVVGDVFELDLVLPGLLGCRVHLVSGPRTLDYERRGVTTLGGSHDDDLRRVLDLVAGSPRAARRGGPAR